METSVVVLGNSLKSVCVIMTVVIQSCMITTARFNIRACAEFIYMCVCVCICIHSWVLRVLCIHSLFYVHFVCCVCICIHSSVHSHQYIRIYTREELFSPLSRSLFSTLEASILHPCIDFFHAFIVAFAFPLSFASTYFLWLLRQEKR